MILVLIYASVNISPCHREFSRPQWLLDWLIIFHRIFEVFMKIVTLQGPIEVTIKLVLGGYIASNPIDITGKCRVVCTCCMIG